MYYHEKPQNTYSKTQLQQIMAYRIHLSLCTELYVHFTRKW